MAIKKPSISRPGVVKPNSGIKKPSMSKPLVEEKVQPIVVKEEPEVVEEKVETIEEVVEEPPVEAVEEIPVETVEEIVEEIIEEEIPADVVVEKQEDEKIAEAIEEPVKEEIKEEVKEETKKKSSRKKSSKKSKAEPKEEIAEEVIEEPKNYKAQNLSSAWNDMIALTECTTPEWEERKATISEQVESMHIDPDSTPAEMRYLIADIDAALSQLKIYKINTDQLCNSLLKQINYISLQSGAKGSNSEERKANAIKGLIYYKKNPDETEYTNLLEIQTYAENQIAFYDEMIKILQDKKNMLITFSGIVKTESQLGSY
jgi:hypothetical protein